MSTSPKILDCAEAGARLGPVVAGRQQKIGDGFSALHFSEEMFSGTMDPLLMVDHFVMTGPTFAPHLHAGISAVTALFEDADGLFLNRDSLGHNIALKPGDLYWLAAARGAAHEEKPADGSRIHALQIFVNLPARLKSPPARALHVAAEDVPVRSGEGHRVRVVLGRSGDTVGAGGTPEEMTMLDGTLDAGGRFPHPLQAGHQAWIYAVSGALHVQLSHDHRRLDAGTAMTVAAGREAVLALSADVPTHFVLIAGRPIHEPFVKEGPLVMSSAADVRRTLDAYRRGRIGRIPA